MEELEKYTINKEVLKACDIRGVYNQNLFEKDFYYIGRAFGTILQNRNLDSICVARDGRLSSRSLKDSLVKGLQDSNINIIDIGLVSSPCTYFAHSYLKVDSCAMVTASHNPGKYNGCKFVLKDTIFGEENINEINNICLEGSFVKTKGTSTYKRVDITNPYINHLLSILDVDKLKNSKIVWDGSNGATNFCLKEFVEKLPGEHILICDEIDGNFPNHDPDPSKEENTKLLKQYVLNTNSDMGIIFDGDGDRLALVTKNGEYVTGDQLLVILAKDYLEKNPGSKVMSEVKASKVFYDSVKEFGGIPVMYKVGHTFQQEKLFEEKIGFAGETSGHIFYLENNGEDDGLYAALKALNICYKNNTCCLQELYDSIPKIFTSGEVRLTLDTENRKILLSNLRKYLDLNNESYCDLDGFRVEKENGFYLARSSNTQPQITTYVEAKTKDDYNLILEDLKKAIRESGYDYDTLAAIKDN